MKILIKNKHNILSVMREHFLSHFLDPVQKLLSCTEQTPQDDATAGGGLPAFGKAGSHYLP